MAAHSRLQGPGREQRPARGAHLTRLFPRALGPPQLQRLGQHRVPRRDDSALLSVPAGSDLALLSQFGEGAAPNLVLSRRCGGGDAEPQALQTGASPTDGITSDQVLSWPICCSRTITCSQSSP